MTNKKEKFTPGPWKMEESIIANEELRKCIVQFGKQFKNMGSEALANARLIAAAPEMLECLQRVFRIMSVDYAKTRPDVLEAVDNLIKKAIGE